MQQPTRNFNSPNYRYGFNGMEKDDELKGEGNSYTTTFRLYDPRIGRWFSIDPAFKGLPEYTPYNFSMNAVVTLNDPDGDCPPGIDCTEPLEIMRVRLNRASNFGPGKVRSGGGRFHAGVDLYSPSGASVLSVMDGEVIAAGVSNSYGNYLTIKHEVKEMKHNGSYTIEPNDLDMVPIPVMEEVVVATYYTFYAHMDTKNFQKGNIIKKGQEIGTVGTTGNASDLTGDNVHLHFEIGTALRQDGRNLSKNHLLSPNVAFKTVKFEANNTNTKKWNKSSIIKTIFDNYRRVSKKILQDYNANNGTKGKDHILKGSSEEAVNDLNEAGGVSSKNENCNTCPPE